jgi:HAD superfamily hydrolase (TIGR01509 family)
MAQEIRSIIFDVGGVIIKPHDPLYYSYLARKSGWTEAEVSYLVSNSKPELENERTTLPRYEAMLSRKLKIPRNEVKWVETFKRNMKVNMDVTDLITELHDDFTVSYLSNIDRARWILVDKTLESLPFDYRFASCNLHMSKPDKKIYQYALKKTKVPAEKTIFIDNMLANVIGASRLGIHSILFKNRKELDIHLAHILES